MPPGAGLLARSSYDTYLKSSKGQWYRGTELALNRERSEDAAVKGRRYICAAGLKPAYPSLPLDLLSPVSSPTSAALVYRLGS